MNYQLADDRKRKAACFRIYNEEARIVCDVYQDDLAKRVIDALNREESPALTKYIDKLSEDQARSIQLLDKAGVATGNEHEEYDLPRRIEWLIKVKEHWMCEVDRLRAKYENRL